ncbi:MAG: OmpP1/FadL family transporter, partial [Opitutales bacterium]
MLPVTSLLPLRARPALAALLALLAAGTVAGSGTRVGFKDAFAMARGNAFVATADNPSTVYYNPAGLTRLDGAQFEGNLYQVAVSSDYSGPGGTASMDHSYQSVPALYATWKPQGAPWAYGFGVYAPFGLSTEWPAGSPLRTFALNNQQTYLTYNFSGAWQVSPAFSLGAGLTYNHVS